MIESPSILIMMATYNGEKYLKEQIESIQSQTYEKWDLIIQDDNSSDLTFKIAQEFANRDERINIVNNDSGISGPYINFHSLINKCKEFSNFDYYCFADQDDIWLEDKLSYMVMQFDNEEVPQLCYADMSIVNDDKEVTNSSIMKSLGLEFKNKTSTFFSHNVFGCNVMFNKALFLRVPSINLYDPSTKILSHDNLYTKFAATLGSVRSAPRVTMYYRRSGQNVTSKQEYTFNIGRIIHRMLRISDLAKDHALTYNQTLTAIQLLNQQGINNQWLSSIRKAILSGGLYSLKVVFKYRVSWGRSAKTISRIFGLIIGIYKQYLVKYE